LASPPKGGEAAEPKARRVRGPAMIRRPLTPTLSPLRGARGKERLRVAVLFTAVLLAACAHQPEGPATALQAFGAALARGDPWGQRPPRAALRTFVRALAERRYDIMLRLVPRRHRADLTAEKLRQYWEAHQEETKGMLARLQPALAAPIVESGDEAHMPYGP